MRSGTIYINSGRLWYAGSIGRDWPSSVAAYTSTTSTTAYNLNFDAISVYASNGPSARRDGYPLRYLTDLKFFQKFKVFFEY